MKVQLSLLQEAATDSLAVAVERLHAAHSAIAAQYSEAHEFPWVIGYSGGKDSTLMVQLAIEHVAALPPEKRTRRVHVVSNDTLVESPIILRHAMSQIETMSAWCAGMGLPVTFQVTRPAPAETFWVLLIGKGYPAPRRSFRWCTERLKINSTGRAVKAMINQHGGVVLFVGSRTKESQQRARSLKKKKRDKRWAQKGHHIFYPIIDLSTEDVWTLLLQRPPPWGGTHRDLVTIYRNAVGECPFVVSADDAPSCGSSSPRMGCWTCTVVEKDRSLRASIDAGEELYEPLADFRDWLDKFSDDPANRCGIRRDKREGLGMLTITARKTVLERLLEAEREVGAQLIGSDERDLIAAQWAADQGTYGDLADTPIRTPAAAMKDRQLDLFDQGAT